MNVRLCKNVGENVFSFHLLSCDTSAFFLHKIRQPKLLLFLLTKSGRDGKFKYLDTLFGVPGHLIFPADLPGHLKIFLHRALMDGWDDIAIADTLSLKLRAFPGKGHPPVTRVAFGAAELLLGERRKIAHQVRYEVGSKNPFCNIVGVNRPDLFCQDKFCIEFFGHGLKLGVHRFDRSC